MIRRVLSRPQAYPASLVIRMAIAGLIAIAGLGSAKADQTASVEARLSTPTVRVAEPFSLELTVNVPQGSKVTFPSTGPQLDVLDVTETQDRFDIPDATDPSSRTWTRRITLESIVTGELEIPAMEIQISNEAGSQVIRSNPIQVQVVSVLEDRGDPRQFRDIQSVVDVAVPTAHSNDWLWWSAGGLFGLSLLAATGMLVLRRGRWISPKDWLQELDSLECSVVLDELDTESTARSLSRIVRDYLLLLFAIPEMGHTPQELMRLLEEDSHFDDRNREQLIQLFALADQAKFAGLQLTPEGTQSAIKDSRALVVRIADDYETNAQKTDTMESH